MTPSRRLDALVRSERHFTSGLLLHLLLHDGLRGVDAFLNLLVARGILAERPVPRAATDPRTQVVAELAVARDLYAAGGAVDDAVPRDVVDVVVVAGTTLVAVEAKFFTRPAPSDVREQLAAQRRALASLARDPAFGLDRVVLVFLEHGRRLSPETLGCEGTLGWDDIHGLARELLGAPSYVTRQLDDAMRRCDAELRPNNPGEVLWESTVSFEQLVALCRRKGDAVLVGFTGGERRLRGDDLVRLQARPWKWDHAESALNAKKNRANWVPGARFLQILRELGAPAVDGA